MAYAVGRGIAPCACACCVCNVWQIERTTPKVGYRANDKHRKAGTSGETRFSQSPRALVSYTGQYRYLKRSLGIPLLKVMARVTWSRGDTRLARVKSQRVQRPERAGSTRRDTCGRPGASGNVISGGEGTRALNGNRARPRKAGWGVKLEIRDVCAGRPRYHRGYVIKI